MCWSSWINDGNVSVYWLHTATAQRTLELIIIMAAEYVPLYPCAPIYGGFHLQSRGTQSSPVFKRHQPREPPALALTCLMFLLRNWNCKAAWPIFLMARNESPSKPLTSHARPTQCLERDPTCVDLKRRIEGPRFLRSNIKGQKSHRPANS